MGNVVKDKSLLFAIRIVKLYGYLKKERTEYVLSKQLLRSGTSVGAMIREAEHAETRKDFVRKMAVAQKEINETIYWLELLYKTNYLSVNQYESINSDAVEIIKLITQIIKTTKNQKN